MSSRKTAAAGAAIQVLIFQILHVKLEGGGAGHSADCKPMQL